MVLDSLLKVRSEKEFEQMAFYDHLTNIPNRFLFRDRLTKAIDLAKGTGKNIGVIFIDLDNFKLVNDIMGRSKGDYLLVKVARILSKFIDGKGMVARSCGDEFMIMLDHVADQKEILKIADGLVALFSKPMMINKREFLMTASAGLAIYPVDGEDIDTLAKNAELTMQKAKAMGKNQYVLCTEEIKQELERKTQLSRDMYKALEKDQFTVHYQPQVNLATGTINGFEALLRWNHPERGMISPGVFIPLAEENGMINNIGEWVLRTACSQGKKWNDMGFTNLCMAVNLSGVQFLDSHIAGNVETILQETGFNPKKLELEITESIAIEQESHAEEVLNKLKKLGIGIAIDDFGTEYSSFSRLKILPIDRIKIDMEFTQGIEKCKKDRAIIMVVITLAKRLGMTVIAEGAETKNQVEFLHQQLCDDVQGYYYYKPMPAKRVERLLNKRS